MKYIVIHEGEAVFNCDSQNHIFRSIVSARDTIDEILDEPESEDLETGKIHTRRTDGETVKDFKIYRLSEVK